MTDQLFSVSDLSKCYRSYRSELQRFCRWFGLKVPSSNEFWALEDISFTVDRGEAVAIIGQNGAGKSTLLKVLTGTVFPDTGTITTRGKISAILELGLGFNPEFTGRENVQYSGGLLGYSADEVHELMGSIEAFAEIGDFFDQPLRVYSSGMQARLAFALATAKRPDLLIVDEVLSVGDSYFQHKSFNRIREFKEAGTSILLVTHSMGDAREICDKAILLDAGRVRKQGDPDEVIDYYNAMMAEKENATLSIEQRRAKDGWLVSRSGSFEIAVESMRLVDTETEKDLNTVRVGQKVTLCVDVRADSCIPQLVLGLMLRDRKGHVVWGTNTWHTKQVLRDIKAEETITFRLDFKCDLGPGSYSISPALVSTDTHLENNYEWTDNLFVFDVVNFDYPVFIGTSFIPGEFCIDRSAAEP